MNWVELLGIVLSTIVAFTTLSAATLRWVLDRHDTTAREAGQKFGQLEGDFKGLERELLELKAELPKEYVRREDWIRFSGTLDAKMDAMEENRRRDNVDMRRALDELKDRIHA